MARRMSEPTKTTSDDENEGKENADENGKIRVALEPFEYMTGGHSLFLQMSRSAICKNYRDEEASFYKEMPKELDEFTPKYLGEIFGYYDVYKGQRRYKGILQTNLADVCGINNQTVDTNTSHSVGTKERQWIVDRLERTKFDWKKGDLKNILYLCSSGESILCPSVRFVRSIIKTQGRFMILENLLCDYNQPSILDVKLGMRPRADKEANETSDKVLPFRIDGCKKFDENTGNYKVLHKEKTRELFSDEVVQVINDFFPQEAELRTEAINEIQRRLEELSQVLSPGKRWKFKAASLLFIYDSTNRNEKIRENLKKCNSNSSSVPNVLSMDQNNGIKANVKLVDFQKSAVSDRTCLDTESPSSGIQSDISKLIQILSDILRGG